MKHADTFIYVARANFWKKRMLSIANVYKEQKLPNACFLMIRAQLRATAMVMDTE
jgi:hypothetical protein